MVHRYFSLHHAPVDDFFRSQWTKKSRNCVWCAFRWLIAAYFAASLVAAVVLYFRDGLWFIFLTNWAMTLSTFVLNFGAILTTLYCCNKLTLGSDSGIVKLYWLLYMTNITIAPMITTVYWVFLFGIQDDDYCWINVTVHILNTVVPLVDFSLSAIPIRIMHVLYVVICISVYTTFALLFQYFGGRNPWGEPCVYPLLDLRKPVDTTVTVLMVIGFLIMNAVILYCLARLRYTLARKLRRG